VRLLFTPQAEADLEEIGDYIALDNPARAVSFIRDIQEHCVRVARQPLLYAERPELGPVVRVCVHKTYLIIYEPVDDGALILRVLHGARDLRKLLDL
jgi:toxin ParE1/3/4